jgi:hypothetical protein
MPQRLSLCRRLECCVQVRMRVPKFLARSISKATSVRICCPSSMPQAVLDELYSSDHAGQIAAIIGPGLTKPPRWKYCEHFNSCQTTEKKEHSLKPIIRRLVALSATLALLGTTPMTAAQKQTPRLELAADSDWKFMLCDPSESPRSHPTLWTGRYRFGSAA